MIHLRVSEEPIVRLRVEEDVSRLRTEVAYEAAYPFTGEYEITPSAETQTILIKGKRALENIVVKPIPSNYGLITWDGSVLTVS